MTDAAGAITLVRDYSPYGETVQSLGSFESPYSYTGEMTDASGLVFLRARYYDPAISRMLTEDSFRGDLTDPRSLNLFAYCESNPINDVDPSGHSVPWTSLSDFKSDWAGREILWHYLYGNGKELNLDDDKDWTKYMESNKTLTRKTKGLVKRYSDQVIYWQSQPVSITTSMEIENGEQIIGYQYLHGTNADVGGYRIKGTISKDRDGNSTILLKYQWNDRIDPNLIYSSDSKKAAFAKLIPFANPTDYTIRISWSDRSVLNNDGYFSSGWLSTDEPLTTSASNCSGNIWG